MVDTAGGESVGSAASLAFDGSRSASLDAPKLGEGCSSFSSSESSAAERLEDSSLAHGVSLPPFSPRGIAALVLLGDSLISLEPPSLVDGIVAHAAGKGAANPIVGEPGGDSHPDSADASPVQPSSGSSSIPLAQVSAAEAPAAAAASQGPAPRRSARNAAKRA